VPKQQRKSYRRLARGTKHRQHARKGILLGECRVKRVLGIRRRRILTPWHLYRFLREQNKNIVDMQI